ncbi:MAG: A/G-specific adenine glycosylase, partial [Halobacteriales archaeon]|nr:A/G-specific adenine glycosylase [Halobacteriales archaeon]
MEHRTIARLAGAWYAAHARDLPWRGRDPWAVLLSEVLLQQTRVATAVPAFGRLLAQFPTPAHLARADEQAVLRAWAGLGYYRRARALHATAKALVADHAGQVPRDEAALAALPGLGPYTVAAVRAFAFDEPAAPLDANVLRVLARLSAEEGDLALPATRARLAAHAQAILAHGSPRQLGQALMELGALVCTAGQPTCASCPLAAQCAARAQGREAELPRKRAKPAPVRERWAFALLRHDGKLLLEQRGPGLLEGFWAPPGARLARGGPASEALEARLEELGMKTTVGSPAARGRWAFTHRTWNYTVHRARLRSGRARGARWVAPAE